jgi:hypothetical protein
MPDRSDPSKAALEAKAWWDRLGQRSITTAEVRAFQTWLDEPENDTAYCELERKTPHSRRRYAVLPSPRGFAVIDTATGTPAIFADAPMVDLDVEDANDIAGILSLREFRARRRAACQNTRAAT